MSKNIHLQFKFTDRGGRLVYEMHDADDNKTLVHPLGQVTMPAGHDLNTTAAVRWYRPEHHGDAPEQGELDLNPGRGGDGTG